MAKRGAGMENVAGKSEVDALVAAAVAAGGTLLRPASAWNPHFKLRDGLLEE